MGLKETNVPNASFVFDVRHDQLITLGQFTETRNSLKDSLYRNPTYGFCYLLHVNPGNGRGALLVSRWSTRKRKKS